MHDRQGGASTSFHGDYVIPESHANAVINGTSDVVGHISLPDVDNVLLHRAVFVGLGGVSVDIAPVRDTLDMPKRVS
jgi:hypothetical protein